jgi:hypothetical protein
MAKDRELKIARILYVEQLKTAKEISGLINVSEATLSKWVEKHNWKDQRNARISSPSVRTDNIRQLINDLSEQRIELGQQLKNAETSKSLEAITLIRDNIARVDDAVSKWNKTLENVDKENRISLSTYISVMEMIFDSLSRYDEKLYMSLLDFQEVHINEVSMKFK